MVAQRKAQCLYWGRKLEFHKGLKKYIKNWKWGKSDTIKQAVVTVLKWQRGFIFEAGNSSAGNNRWNTWEDGVVSACWYHPLVHSTSDRQGWDRTGARPCSDQKSLQYHSYCCFELQGVTRSQEFKTGLFKRAMIFIENVTPSQAHVLLKEILHEHNQAYTHPVPKWRALHLWSPSIHNASIKSILIIYLLHWPCST